MLAVFQFESNQVRVITIQGEPWFVAKDLCNALEIINVSQAVSRLDNDERGIYSNDTPGGKQDMAIISESGMYALVLSSRKHEAKKFRKWVTSEVLPSIRKTGKYESEQQHDKVVDISDISEVNQEAYQGLVTSLLTGDLTFDQRLRLLGELNKFLNILLQFYKLGAKSIVEQLSNLIQLFQPPTESNMRLAVQVQKEYRESTEVQVQICEEIKEYVDPTNLEQQVQKFFKDYIQECPGQRISAVGLHETYEQFCKINKYQIYTHTAFGKEAAKYAIKRRKANGVYYLGIALK